MYRKLSLMALLRRRTLRSERGIALPMVLLVFIVGVALITAFLVAITGASRVTVTSRDTVRAQAAAEAGIADVLGKIADPATTLCSLASAALTDPASKVNYSATVDFGTPGSFTVPASWSTACPTKSTLLRIVSTGTFGAAKQRIERIHKLTATPAASIDFDDIILSEGAWTFGGNTDLSALDTSRPADVRVTTGDFNCNASGTIKGSVYVKNGNATLTGACSIAGNLEVSGNLVRNGSGTVGGNAVVRGTVNLSGGTLPAIKGSLTHGGALTVSYGNKSTWVGGAINQTPVTITAPPAWRDLSLSSFVAAGFTKKTWSGSCTASYSPTHGMVATIATYTTPTVIDATACSTLTIESNDNIKLATDVAIVAPKMVLKAFTFGSTTTAKHNLYVVSSATVNTAQMATSCPTSRVDIQVAGVNFTDKKITGLLYAQCRVQMDNWGPYWLGSIYSRNFSGTPLLTFAPITDPNTVGGGSGTPSTSGTLTLEVTPVSVRNVKG